MKICGKCFFFVCVLKKKNNRKNALTVLTLTQTAAAAAAGAAAQLELEASYLGVSDILDFDRLGKRQSRDLLGHSILSFSILCHS